MISPENIYEVIEVSDATALKYFFVSVGNTNVIKAIEYKFVRVLKGSPVFNLGFGDYDLQKDIINDQADTNNGDHYSVLHTVLSTVPKFFNLYPHATMVVQGSDSGDAFLHACKSTCIKKCEGTICLKLNRRIKTYRYFIEKNYDSLTNSYHFFGAVKVSDALILDEKYKIGTEYDLVFCKKL